MKILIELPTWLGDAVMTTPAIENLSSYYDKPEITLIGSFISVEMLKNHLLGVGFGNFTNLGHEYIKDKVIEEYRVKRK